MPNIITLPDGRIFPTYMGEILSWSLTYMPRDEAENFPRLRAVIRAMRTHRPEQLRVEYADCLRGMRGFFRGARVTMRVLLAECPDLEIDPDPIERC